MADVVDLSHYQYITEWPEGVYPGDLFDPAARQAAIARHPAGKGRDQQAGIAELLATITAPPLPEFEDHVHDVMFELAELMVRKQKDYGPRAINDSPGGALNGINVRMHDKLSRIVNLLAKGEGPAVSDESLRDTYRDLANYGVIAVMVLEGTWPK